MNKAVVGIFDKTYWSRWGASWLGSLIEFGRFAGRIIIVDLAEDLDIPIKVVRKYGVEIVRPIKHTGFRDVDRYLTVAKMAEEFPGVYVVYDGDVYFQDDINSLWDQIDASDKLVFCQDGMIGGDMDPYLYGYGYLKSVVSDSRNLRQIAEAVKSVSSRFGHTAQGGMVGGTSNAWQLFACFTRYCFDANLVKPVYLSDQLVLNLFASYFPFCVEMKYETWNCIVKETMKWNEGAFYVGSRKMKAVHLAGAIKDSAEGWYFKFQERYKSEYNEWHTAINNPSAVPPRAFAKHVGGKAIKFNQRKKGLLANLDKRHEFLDHAGTPGILEIGSDVSAAREGGEELLHNLGNSHPVDAGN